MYNIIGISDSRNLWFPPEVMQIISQGRVFSGGKRHHDIVRSFLPDDAEWLDITVPLSDVFEQYKRHKDMVIFASGDPLFYGFANTLQREMPEVEMRVYPSFNSLQMLAHRLNMPYHDMHVVSLTGRPWNKFDEALINGERLIGCLTDKHNTPQAIIQRMLTYGYDNYEVFIGENLGNEDEERITSVKLSDLSNNPDYQNHSLFTIHYSLNCILLRQTHPRQRPFGIPESDFHLLDGRAKMITKMPVRLLSLSFLDLRNKQTFWDVGFCTGSVSIEAKLQFPHLNVFSFDIRKNSLPLMEKNSALHGTPGITAQIGDFLELDVTALPRPDAIFIGGHGGKLPEMVHKIHELMNEGACIVFNSVSDESRQTFEASIAAEGMTIVQQSLITIDNHNPIYILKAQ